MAAADITVNQKWATIEVDDTARKITVESAGGNIVNVGSQSVFLSMSTEGDLARDGLQNDGEIELAPDDSVPVPADASGVRFQCAASQVSKLWFIPRAG